jgi:hypothetical protein
MKMKIIIWFGYLNSMCFSLKFIEEFSNLSATHVTVNTGSNVTKG